MKKTEIEKARALTTRPVYLESDLHDLAFRTEPAEQIEDVKWFAKMIEGEEFETRFDTVTVTDATLEWNEITEEQYQEY